MNAIINLPATTKIPKGKYIDLSPIREFVNNTGLCTIKEAIELINTSDIVDMSFDEIKNWLKKYYIKNYSQNNEQEIILNFFKDFKGTFLDCGANDGITLSNTYALSLLGWAGTLVEASPKVFQRLLKNIPFENDIVALNVAVGNYDGEIILHESGELLGQGDISLVSSTKQEEVHRWDSLKIPFEDVKVPCVTFQTLLSKTKHKTFHFLSLDIEGGELDVLPQIDFNALGTRLVCIEFNGKEKWKYDHIMLPFGFSLIHQNAENLFYSK